MAEQRPAPQMPRVMGRGGPPPHQRMAMPTEKAKDSKKTVLILSVNNSSKVLFNPDKVVSEMTYTLSSINIPACRISALS